MVRLASRAALARATLNRSVWARQLAGTDGEHLFLFTSEGAGHGYDFQARMFAPGGGVEEDPATGSAAAALGGWLGSTSLTDGTISCVIAQGVEIGRPSRLEVEVERAGTVLAVRVGGSAVLMSDGTIEVPAVAQAAPTEVAAEKVLAQGAGA
jgi:trans-2,3-dihydro-3-hydroxyanthranilate isomerase